MAAFYMNTNNQVDQVAYWPDSYPDASTHPGGIVMYMNPNFIPNSTRHVINHHEFALFPNCATEESDSHYMPIVGCKFLKPAQQLLHEAVSVKLPAYHCRNRRNDRYIIDREVSIAERHDLQGKLMKLSSMLNEVERRYREYSRELQRVSTSFDAIAGNGSGQQYSAHASQIISKQFRRLRDAITAQIAALRRMTGEEASVEVIIPRLRPVDRRFTQMKLGEKQQLSWRPQRGLPESSVSILRAWLFEHFLHPYPRDSDKMILAKQAGLTRSQVSNWFINARVRLWKPMVEEMYKDESGEGETDSNLCGRSFEGGESKESEVDVSGGIGDGVSLTLGLQHCDAEAAIDRITQGTQATHCPWN